MRDHTKLKAFQLADALAVAVYQATSDFPPSERFALVPQMRRAGISVATNVVEGCARQSEADYLRFLDIAYGSAKELQYLLTLATQLGFVEQVRSVELTRRAEETSRVLAGLMQSLRR